VVDPAAGARPAAICESHPGHPYSWDSFSSSHLNCRLSPPPACLPVSSLPRCHLPFPSRLPPHSDHPPSRQRKTVCTEAKANTTRAWRPRRRPGGPSSTARACEGQPMIGVRSVATQTLLIVKYRVKLRSASARVGCSFSLRVSPKINQSVEQVDYYAQLSTNVVDLKLFIK
jgi:hypothetical protein